MRSDDDFIQQIQTEFHSQCEVLTEEPFSNALHARIQKRVRYRMYLFTILFGLLLTPLWVINIDLSVLSENLDLENIRRAELLIALVVVSFVSLFVIADE